VRILGFDPGSIHTGFGVLQVVGSRLESLAVGRVTAPRGALLPARLALLASEARELLARWQPDLVAIETPYRGINARSLIVLAEARGALVATVALAGAEIREFSPAEVKLAVAGNGRAEKDQVAKMVRLLLRLPADRLAGDATDALAVAVCCAHRLRMDALQAPRPRA
jgi:crossover junction endodeoxyribonuclease RuvC